MKNTKIKLIIFDFNGVVMLGDHYESCEWLRKHYAPQLSFKEVYRVVYTKYFNQAAVSKINLRQSWALPLKELGIDLDWRVIYRYHCSIHRMNKPVWRLIAKLRRQGYPVLILSKNLRAYVNYCEKKFHFKRLVDAFINTQDLNLPKMSPQTMQYVCRRFKVRPEEIIYIDDKKDNLDPATKAGSKTILWKNFPDCKKKIYVYLKTI